MNLLNKLLAVVLAASSATAAQADNYVAQSITVTTTDKGSTAMKLLGTTAAGNQVWSCSNNDVAGGKGATWTIDGGTAISASEANFAPTYPVNSTSLSAKFDESKGRQFTSVTSPEQYHFLKVNSQTSADFFVWNMANLLQSKIEDFILSPTVTLTGSDVAGCTDDVSRATHVVSWTVTGLTSEAIDHLTLRWSYNGGRTWEADSLCNLTGSENSFTVTHPFAQDSVRYQIAVYPKSCYRIVTDKSMWRSAETAEYDISCTKRVVFNATKVEKREVGTGFKENFTDMSLLGITQDGHQIWGSSGISNGAMGLWRINGDKRLSYNTNNFNANTEYTLITIGTETTSSPSRRVPEGSQYYHFIKVNAADAANFVCCAYDAKTNYKQADFLIDAKPVVNPASGFTYNTNDANICQDVDWSVKNVNGLMLDSITVSFSCNGGVDWTQTHTLKSLTGQEYNGKVTVSTLPIEASRVRYRLKLYPNNNYKVVCNEWTAETPDLVVNLPKGNLDKTAVYLPVTSEDELEAGGTYIILYDGMAMGKQVSGYQRKTQNVTTHHNKVKVEGYQIAPTAYSMGSNVAELKLGGEKGKWTLFDKMSLKYLCASSGTNADNFYIDQQDAVDENAQASIDFTNGKAVITFGGNNTNNTLSIHTLTKSYYFYCIHSAAASVAGDTKMSIYRKVSIFSITSAGYGTFYTDEAYTMPTGVTGYTVTTDDNESLSLNELYPAGSVVPARTPLLLKGAEGEYDILQLLNDDAAPTNNLLHGSTTKESTYIQGATAYYKLSKGTDGKVGFYWGAAEGAPFLNAPYKAYLALSTTAESQQRGFALDLDDATTSIETIATQPHATAPTVIYDLNGRRLSTLSGAQKGVYIVNGKKVMVK